VCLIGASGCGKSTLLRIIAGFETATAGVVEMYGAPITSPGPERGMVFQDFALFPWLTVKENIGFGPRQRGLPSDKLDEIAARYTDMVGLTKFADYYPSQLSGGMKQRVAIARVLANDCEVLLMDEPFGALDALTREKLQQELLEIWERTKVTVIFVTHSVEEAVVLSDRVVVMTAGPGRIEQDARIQLPRPREVSAIDFNQVRRDITQRLTSHVGVKSVPAAA
jgi:NitT/TauT family transport system ATP-binding protein/sulfonate transport system ATP-binding protein